MEDDALEYGQYYLYMFDNNFGYSKTRKDYDWTVNDGIQTSITEGTTSYYYQYLVDEMKGHIHWPIHLKFHLVPMYRVHKI